MRKALTILLLFIGIALHAAVSLTSPDGRIKVEISTDGRHIIYNVYCDGTLLMEDSRAAMHYKGVARKLSFKASKARLVREHITAPFYRQAEFDSEYNETVISMGNGESVAFRAYDDGIAYRFMTSKARQTVEDETAEFRFANDGMSWLPYSTNEKDEVAMAFQNIYTAKKLSEQSAHLAFLPVTVDCGVAKVTLLESDLEAYPGMFVAPKEGSTSLKGVFARYPKRMDKYAWRGMSYVAEREDFIAKTTERRSFPWRVIAVSTDDTQMPVNNMVYALASPNRIGDCSWVSTGKVAWDWWHDWNIKGVPFKAGINTETYKHYIDFAADHGLQYVILDEGWYDSPKADIMHPIADIDLSELIRYGKERGVGIILWAVFNVVDEHLDEVFTHYAGMGVKGFKIDFMDRDDQTAVEMAYRIAAKAAENRLVLDYHGFYKPTGFNRTFPNILNVESVFGMEEMKWNEDGKDMPMYDVTFPYIRMMAGIVDYTPGAMRNATKNNYKPIYDKPMSMGTRCHQAAAYVVHDSPLTMLADAPSAYRADEEYTRFIASIPENIDETRVLAGRLGEYIITARRHAINWYVGGMTNWDGRDVTVDFSFLGDGEYDVTLYRDGVNADKDAEDYAVERFKVTKGEKKDIRMASGGGFAMSVEKDNE